MLNVAIYTAIAAGWAFLAARSIREYRQTAHLGWLQAIIAQVTLALVFLANALKSGG
jgi:hypothetical protein